jgi:hypothetical protein
MFGASERVCLRNADVMRMIGWVGECVALRPWLARELCTTGCIVHSTG